MSSISLADLFKTSIPQVLQGTHHTLKPKTILFSLSIINFNHVLSLTFLDYLEACPEVIYKNMCPPREIYSTFCFINMYPRSGP